MMPRTYTFSLNPSEYQPSGSTNLSRINNFYNSVTPTSSYESNNIFIKKRIYNKFCPLSMRNIMKGEYYVKCKYCNNHFCEKAIKYYDIKTCPICNENNYFYKYYINIDPNDKSYIFEEKPKDIFNNIRLYANNYNVLRIMSGMAGLRYST